MPVLSLKQRRETRKKAKVPRTLSAEAKQLFRELHEQYRIDDAAGIILLTRTCEALDRLRCAQKIIRAEGIIVRDNKGSIKSHPAVAIERDAHRQMLEALKAQNLDIEPLRPIGRPGAA